MVDACVPVATSIFYDIREVFIKLLLRHDEIEVRRNDTKPLIHFQRLNPFGIKTQLRIFV